MTALYIFAAALVALVLFGAIYGDRRAAIGLAVVGLIALWTQFQGIAGTPANGDTRLSAEQWLVLSVAQLSADDFLVAVKYRNGDIRAYRLVLPTQEDKDKFLDVQQRMRRGLLMMGRAKHPRIGRNNDGDMDFEFGQAPETEPKAS